MNSIVEKFKLKKLLLLVVITILCCVVLVIHNTKAESAKPANEAFEDYNFYMEIIDKYNYINKKSYEYNHNLTDEELSTITELNAGTGTSSMSPIISIKGIEKLTNLEDFRLQNSLTNKMDFSKNLNLDTLVLDINQLENLDVTKNENLRLLNIGSNRISNIDLTNNLKLERLEAYYNKITSMNVTANKKLKYINLTHNPISNIDLSQNSELMEIDFESTNITQLDIRNNTNLINLDLDNNNINTLDLSFNNRLQSLHLKNNNLTNLDLSHNNDITQMYVDGNHLMSLDMSNMNPIYWNDEYIGTQTIDLPVKVVSNNYSLNLKEHDNNLNPERVTITTDNVNYDNKTGIITFSNKIDTISYKYNTGINDVHIIVNVSLKYPTKLNSFYIGNTANDVYTNSLNVNIHLESENSNATHYCISTENNSEHCDWKSYRASATYTLTPGDGEKTLYAFIKNSDGLISNAKSDSIILDTTKPVVQSVYIGGSNNPVYATNTSSNIYFTYQDSDVASYCIKDTNDNSNCTWNNVTSNTMTIPYTLTSNNGNKVVYVFLKDRAGNISLGKEDTIILDTINPTIDKFYIGGSNNPDVITDNNTNIYLSWQDEDVASYCIKTENDISDCVWNNVNGKSINASYNVDEVNGTKTLYAFIKDKADLVSSVKSDTVLLDSKKPIIDIFYIGGRTNPEEIGDTNTIVYLKWSDTDVVKYCINTENNANNCTWNNTSNQEVETEYILPGVNGEKTLYAFLKDSSGLISNGKSDTITLNSTKPLIKSFAINNNAKYTTNKEISYKLITEENNIVSYCINTVNSSNNCNWINNSNQEINGNYTLNNPDGNKTLYVYLKNNLDVISNVASDSIILDTTKPIIDEFFIGGVDNPTYINNKNTTIYSVFKDLDVVSYCINTINDSNNCTWNTISSNKINTNYTISNNDGNITLYLFLKDEAGLISNSKSDNVILDTEKPTVKDFYFGNTTVSNEKILLEITITEDDVISYCVSDKNNSNNCKWKEVTSKNIKEEYILTGGNGEKSIYVYLKDKAGNITSSKELKITLQKSNVGSSVDNNLNENEADKPLNNSPQTGSLEISILIILLAITSIYCFIKFKKKNYIFKV